MYQEDKMPKLNINNKRNKVIFIIAVITLIILSLVSIKGKNKEIEYIKPNEEGKEFRGVWVTTAYNLDFPKTNNEQEFRTEFQSVLDNVKDLNLNSIVFQVVPMLDAWYISEVNPKSYFASSEEQLSYDPLKIAIEMAHNEGIDLHAWINPYRASDQSKRSKDFSDMSFAKQNPDAIYEFGNQYYLDPGNPKVLKHLTDTISEIITKYDVDGIHFDDYFYPYTTNINNKTVVFKNLDIDRETFNNYNRGIADIETWRMDNINLLVKSIKEVITNHNIKNNKSVQFGISPFGIWGHSETTNGKGSNTPTSSTASIDDYVDTLKWVEEGWVDYIAPQLYWEIDYPKASYSTLIEWWNSKFDNISNVHLYSGNGVYRYNNRPKWYNPSELANQMIYNKRYSNTKGAILFSYRDIVKTPNKIESNQALDILTTNHFNKTVLQPSKEWLDYTETLPIENVSVNKDTNSITLNWENNKGNIDDKYYAIYKSDTIENLNKSENLLTVLNKDIKEYNDREVDLNQEFYYGISIIDKSNSETDIKVISIK